MARKLVPLEEAAKTLGVSPDDLNGMRESRKIYGYRDGASWKFKPEDIERLAQELAERGAVEASDSSSLAVDLGDSDDDGEDIVLLSEGDIGGPAGGSSTVIGAQVNLQSPEDSDLKLADSIDLTSASSVELVGASGSSTVIPKPGRPSGESSVHIRVADEHDSSASASDVLPVDLGDEGEDKGPASDLALVTEQTVGESQEGGGPGSDLTLVTGGSSGKIVDGGPGSDLTLATGGSSVKIVDGGPGSDLTLATGGSSGKLIGGGPGSDLTLGGDDDDVFKLQDDSAAVMGSGPGSDITISPGDSGINLIDPSDSGISLEEPLELSPADDESSFDLSSDSSGDSSGTLGDSSEFDSDAVMELQSEDEFLLTPLEESIDDESQDSGSQVIALDSDTDFDDATPTVMGQPDALGGALLEADDAGQAGGFAPADLGLGAAIAPGLAVAPGMVMAPVREARYGILDMSLLTVAVLLLAVGGMMGYDLMRNMWSWDGAYAANSFLMDSIMGMR